MVFPVRQDVDGDEGHLRGKRRMLAPEFPDVGIGDRHARTAHAFCSNADKHRLRQFPPQQHLVADDQRADDVRPDALAGAQCRPRVRRCSPRGRSRSRRPATPACPTPGRSRGTFSRPCARNRCGRSRYALASTSDPRVAAATHPTIVPVERRLAGQPVRGVRQALDSGAAAFGKRDLDATLDRKQQRGNQQHDGKRCGDPDAPRGPGLATDRGPRASGAGDDAARGGTDGAEVALVAPGAGTEAGDGLEGSSVIALLPSESRLL